MRFSTPSDDDAWDHCESLRVLLCDAQESAVPVHLRTLANGTPYLTMAGSRTSDLLSVHDVLCMLGLLSAVKLSGKNSLNSSKEQYFCNMQVWCTNEP